MFKETEKRDMNNAIFLENKCSMKEDFEDKNFDNKIFISKTIININGCEFKEQSRSDKINQYKITNMKKIKTELSPFEEHILNDNIKVEDVVNSSDNIKVESKFKNKQLFCDHCTEEYQDYCTKCGMLVHILNRNITRNAKEDIAGHILEIKELFGDFGIFALKVIPEGVKFGPFIGPTINPSKCSWRIRGGKFVASEDNSKFLNWMQFINPARSILQRNLFPFQYEDNIYMYYRSTRQIQEGEELLVSFGDEYEHAANKEDEMDFIPFMEKDCRDVFACTFCCLGFSSSVSLAKHKSICLASIKENIVMTELMHCPFCKIYLSEKEYYGYHMAYCRDTNDRKPFPLLFNNRAAETNRRKIRRPRIHKCTRCNYNTPFKSDLNSHTNTHFQVKTCKCTTCYRRFKTKESHRVHVENAHIKHEGRESQMCPTNDCVARRDGVKLFKCRECNFQTKFKFHLKLHVNTKHLGEFKHKCALCKYRTNSKWILGRHMKAKHLREFSYKCKSCQYATNNRLPLEMHVKTRHLKEFDYKCESCEFKTNYRLHFRRHVKTKHLKEFNYNCETCEFKTNDKAHLKRHVKTKHLKEFKYGCVVCEYKTDYKAQLEVHVRSVHVKEFKFKCVECQYETNYKKRLRSHVKTKHLKEFNHECATCDFKTNCKTHLKRHINIRHRHKEINHKCTTCNFQTNSKSYLESHVNTKHLNEFKYKCDICGYKTDRKPSFEAHVKSKHLREFSYGCASCAYQTNRKSDLIRHARAKHLKEST